MLIPIAEETYHKGLKALAKGRRKEAMAMFEAAIELGRKYGATPQARYLSYYGLCLGLEKHEMRESLRFCREAVTLEGYNPDLRCNLGRVLVRAGRRKEAYEHFTRGLQMETRHKAIRYALKLMGKRRRPAIPFLSRQHPINVFLGRRGRAA